MAVFSRNQPLFAKYRFGLSGASLHLTNVGKCWRSKRCLKPT